MVTQNPNFTANQDDLAYILKQIVVAEREVAGESLQSIIGLNAAILPWGLRHVDGSNNNLLPGGQFVGAADQILPRLLDPNFRNDQDGDQLPRGPPPRPGDPGWGLICSMRRVQATGDVLGSMRRCGDVR
ncbi:hypothetical protein [Rhizobium sp. BK060]|uniref:hypothetical protein n=1 Tax=Rhizobium sp. BK060 TaxID=2587096 RepID=UPI00161A5E6E|nr:hypothetical protein [Rhizobium sp. BK060]MBB3399732.1 hypothetical protein [Rhizobium sp. BK060]